MTVTDLAEAASLFKLSRAIQVAAAWGLFEALHGRSFSVAELSARTRHSAAQIEAIAGVLVPAGVLTFQAGRLSIASAHQAQTHPHGERSKLNYLKWMAYQYGQFERLLADEDQRADWSVWIGCLEELAREGGYAHSVAACLPLEAARTLLDIGGGSGLYARALCERFAGLHVTLFDRPSVVAIAERQLSGSPVHARIRLVSGDFATDDLPGPVDAVFASNLLHGKSDAMLERLCSQAKQVLQPSGLFIIHGHHCAPDFDHSLEAGLLNLTMTINGGAGSFSIDRLCALMDRHGFEVVATAAPRGEPTADILWARPRGKR